MPRKSSIPLDDEMKFAVLMDACRGLIAEEGLRGISLRSVVRAAGWTMGELNYRVGSKQQLLAVFCEVERERFRKNDQAWRDRLSAVSRLDSTLLAQIVAAYLDDMASAHRQSAICAHEILIAAGMDETLRDPAVAWLRERELFWRGLLAGRVEDSETLAQVLSDYIAAEQIYSVALGDAPWYRLLRAACLTRLCARSPAPAGDGWSALLPGLQVIASPPATTSSFSKPAGAAARAAARLILEQGPASITHRAVAESLGLTASAVFHHFRTQVDLVAAGFQSLYDDIQLDLLVAQRTGRAAGEAAAPATMRASTSSAVQFVRAMHIVALAGVRDASFLPLLASERAVRGRLIADWFGDDLVRRGRYDRLAYQVISIVTGGRTLRLAANGDPTAGATSAVLEEIFPERL